MDLPRLLFLLEESALYFSRLKNLDDPYEGVLSKPAVESLMRHKTGEPNVRFLNSGTRALMCVSSWHLSEHESAAMWKIYSAEGLGIAIRSSVGAIQESLRESQEDVVIGRVKYIDYLSDEAQFDNMLALAYHKRKSFEHEAELRLSFLDVQMSTPGKAIRVDVAALIERVYVAPKQPVWVAALLAKVLKRYDLHVEVVHSDIDEPPLY